jgi:imidazolonepropionase
MMHYDLLIENVKVLTCDDQNNTLECAIIAISKGVIVKILTQKGSETATNSLDGKGQLLTPGLIDCHTHLVYAGSRANEFAMRLEGVSYAEIAAQGGGIVSTVEATRKASAETLTESAKQRAQTMFNHGTTTVEIKSGYGLDLPTEVKMLQVAKSLENILPISVIPTFLGVHAIPKEYEGNADGYVDYVISTVLPVIANENLAKFVDAFCESIAFNTNQVERLFKAAKKLGFHLKLHAEQLTDQKGSVLAAKYGANSVDHLEFLAPDDCVILAEHDTVAVLLPGAFYFLKETQLPPVEALQSNGVSIAIATDANPGSSPFLTLPLMMNMACVFFGLSIQDAFKGVTINAAKALDIADNVGSIEVGKQADLILWRTDNINDIVYNPTMNFCDRVIKAGVGIKIG